MPTTHKVAHDFTAVLRLQGFAAAGEKHWADDVKSVEPRDLPGGIPAVVLGIAATRTKHRTWLSADRITDLSIDGPFVTGNQFALFIDMMIVGGADPAPGPFSEIALYTVHNGRVTEERYFYD